MTEETWLTIAQVAERLGLSEQRVRALAADRHKRLGIGWKVPGRGNWLFRPHEIELLRPGPAGRPKRLKPE